jgi:hypothetical protein
MESSTEAGLREPNARLAEGEHHRGTQEGLESLDYV